MQYRTYMMVSATMITPIRLDLVRMLLMWSPHCTSIRGLLQKGCPMLCRLVKAHWMERKLLTLCPLLPFAEFAIWCPLNLSKMDCVPQSPHNLPLEFLVSLLVLSPRVVCRRLVMLMMESSLALPLPRTRCSF